MVFGSIQAHKGPRAPNSLQHLRTKIQNPKPHLTPGAKGKAYIPEKHDDREEAGRRKNMMGQVNMERGKNTQRNVFPGLEGFKQLTKGLEEQIETNYKQNKSDEVKILENNIEIKNIIENLKQRDKKENGKV